LKCIDAYVKTDTNKEIGMPIIYPIGLGLAYFGLFLILHKVFKIHLKFGFYALILVTLVFAMIMLVRSWSDNTGWMQMGMIVSIILMSYVAATYAALWAIYNKLVKKKS
jgi:hypothetical protein